MRTTQNVDRLGRIIRNAKTQIILAERSGNHDRAYQVALNAVDETGRMMAALSSYAQAKSKRVHVGA
jgi:hypothetical protein